MSAERKTKIYKKVASIIRTKNKSSYIGEDDVVFLEKNGIRISFHLKNNGLDLVNIFRTVKRAQKLIKDKFDCDIEQMNINIYDSSEDLRRNVYSPSRCGSWIAGIFDGEIRIISERNGEDPEALYILITHEIIHLAIRQIGRGNCSYWLDEGLAVYLSQELPEYYQRIFLAAARNESLLPLEALEKPLSANIDDDARILAYAESTFMVNYLCENYDWEKIKTAVRKSRIKDMKDILDELGLNYYLLELSCKRWVLMNVHKELL